MAERHNFKEDLAWANSLEHEPFWLEVYKKYFPAIQGSLKVNDNQDWQRRGVDRILFMPEEYRIYTEEKPRKKVYPDIALEYLTDIDKNTPGWITKDDMLTDYFVYAFKPIKTAYIIPWPALRRAWVKYGEEWKDEYKSFRSETARWDGGTYWSKGAGIPIEVLTEAVDNRVAKIVV